MNSELFTKNLQKLITEHGYTLQDVADKTGLTSSTISKYINGHMVPKNKNLLALAKVFSISVSELMGEKEQESPEEKLIKSIIDKTLDEKIKWTIEDDDSTVGELYFFSAKTYISSSIALNIDIGPTPNEKAFIIRFSSFDENSLFFNKIESIYKLSGENDILSNKLFNLAEAIYNKDNYLKQKEEQEHINTIMNLLDTL